MTTRNHFEGFAYVGVAGAANLFSHKRLLQIFLKGFTEPLIGILTIFVHQKYTTVAISFANRIFRFLKTLFQNKLFTSTVRLNTNIYVVGIVK